MALALACGTWAAFVEPRRVQRQHFSHEVRGLRPDQRLRLAILGDLHVGAPHFGEAALTQVLQRVCQEKVDALILVGDYVIQTMPGGRPVPIERTAELLAETGLPIVAIIGNHDVWDGRERIKTALTDVGAVFLDNEHTLLQLGEQPLCVVGLDDESTGRPDPPAAFPEVPPEVPVLILAHDPSTFMKAMPYPGDLLLSGHTHGGQIRLPGVGALVVPGRSPLRWAHGWTKTQSGPLYVTSGLGTSVVGLRFCCPPEYVVMDLVPLSTSPGQ